MMDQTTDAMHDDNKLSDGQKGRQILAHDDKMYWFSVHMVIRKVDSF